MPFQRQFMLTLTHISTFCNKMLVVALPWAVVILCATGYITVITSLLTLLSVLCCLTCIRALALSAIVKHMQQLQEAGGVAPVNLINLHLAMLERDLTERDYESLLALDCETPIIHPVSDALLASLPVHRHGASSAQAMVSSPPQPKNKMILTKSVSPVKSIPRMRPPLPDWQCTPSPECVSTPPLNTATTATTATPALRGHSEYASSPCCVCLEGYVDDQAVVTLPTCGHHFHNECIVTWIKCRGMSARCPLCNARVFTSQGTCVQGV